jgi:hypothetical protein
MKASRPSIFRHFNLKMKAAKPSNFRQFNLKMEAERSSETLISYCTALQTRWGRIPLFRRTTLLPSSSTLPWIWKQQSHPKRWYPTASLPGVTIQNSPTWIYTALKSWNLAKVARFKQEVCTVILDNEA